MFSLLYYCLKDPRHLILSYFGDIQNYLTMVGNLKIIRLNKIEKHQRVIRNGQCLACVHPIRDARG